MLGCQSSLKPESWPTVKSDELWDRIEGDLVDVWAWSLYQSCSWYIGQQLCYRRIRELPHKILWKTSLKMLCQTHWWRFWWYSSLTKVNRYTALRRRWPPRLDSRRSPWFVLSGVWIMIDSEKIFTVDETVSWSRTHLPCGRSRWPRRSLPPAARMPRASKLYHVTVNQYKKPVHRLKHCLSVRHGSSRQ
jgi:hypothetical protein